MQSLQAMSKVPTQSGSLPPLQNLPSWSRNSLGRRKEPRPIIRDRLQPIKSIREEMDESAEDRSNDKSGYSGRIVSAPSRGHGLDQAQRMENIEKRIEYLSTQHAETLANLHSEIERLKAENKGEAVDSLYENNSASYLVVFRVAFDRSYKKKRKKKVHIQDFSNRKISNYVIIFVILAGGILKFRDRLYTGFNHHIPSPSEKFSCLTMRLVTDQEFVKIFFISFCRAEFQTSYGPNRSSTTKRFVALKLYFI